MMDNCDLDCKAAHKLTEAQIFALYNLEVIDNMEDPKKGKKKEMKKKKRMKKEPFLK